MNLTQESKIYFIGIGGIAMSATAGIAKELRYDVSGSDSKAIYNPAKSVLDDLDIPYHVGYDAKHVTDLLQSSSVIFIASAGEDMSNPEVSYLRENDIEINSLSELLFELSKEKLRVVVTGTHGKSTTTAMLGQSLKQIDDSSFMTGAVLTDLKRNFYFGDGHYFTFEGDEYKALFDDPTPKFQQYKPDIVVLTNLEFDHPDMFSSVEEIKAELAELLDKMPDDGIIFYNADASELLKTVHHSNLGQVSFGIHNPADFSATNIQTLPNTTTFTVNKIDPVTKIETSEDYSVNAFGEMNVYNALAVITTLRTLGFSHEQVQMGLSFYHGIKRRFELIGQFNNAMIFDDYAHHPTAIKETLAAARLRFPDSRIWAIFEPHTFSRTEAVLGDLSKSFEFADRVLLAEIYPAREKKTDNSITGAKVVEEIAKKHKDVRLVSDKQATLEILRKGIEPGDVVIVMAVGSFNTLAHELVGE